MRHIQSTADYGGLGVDIYVSTGDYQVTVNNHVWLIGQDTFITVGGKVNNFKIIFYFAVFIKVS